MPIFVFASAFAVPTSLLMAQSDAQDELAKPFDWSVISSNAAGIQLSLRTSWQDGVLKYVAIINDGKGRVARYFSKHRDDLTGQTSSFQITFTDEAGFRLYDLYILDHTFSKVENTANFESTGDSPFTEKMYRAALKASNVTDPDKGPIWFKFPTELTELAPRPSGKRQR